MNTQQVILLLAAGVAAGYVNVMAGGGSLLTVPALLFAGLPAPVANGTNRIAVLAQCLAATGVFLRRGLSEWRLTAGLALATLPGAWLGARLGARFDGPWFNRTLALIMAVVMVLVSRPPAVSAGGGRLQRPWLTHICMVPVGFYGGLIQVGVGFLIMPVLNRVGGLDLVRVNVHKVALVIPFTLLSLVVFAREAGVAWQAGLVLALGNALGGYLGGHSMLRGGEALVRAVFTLAAAAIIVKLLFFA